MSDKIVEQSNSPLSKETRVKLLAAKRIYDFQLKGLTPEEMRNLTIVRQTIRTGDPKYSEHQTQSGMTRTEDRHIRKILSNSLTSKDRSSLRYFKKAHKSTRKLEEMGYSPEEARSTQHRLRKAGFSEPKILRRAYMELQAKKQLESEK